MQIIHIILIYIGKKIKYVSKNKPYGRIIRNFCFLLWVFFKTFRDLYNENVLKILLVKLKQMAVGW